MEINGHEKQKGKNYYNSKQISIRKENKDIKRMFGEIILKSSQLINDNSFTF